MPRRIEKEHGLGVFLICLVLSVTREAEASGRKR
jgi:hypothetical protein